MAEETAALAYWIEEKKSRESRQHEDGPYEEPAPEPEPTPSGYRYFGR